MRHRPVIGFGGFVFFAIFDPPCRRSAVMSDISHSTPYAVHFMWGVVVKGCPSSHKNDVYPTPPSVISAGGLPHFGHLLSRCHTEFKQRLFLHCQSGGLPGSAPTFSIDRPHSGH